MSISVEKENISIRKLINVYQEKFCILCKIYCCQTHDYAKVKILKLIINLLFKIAKKI